MNTRSPQDTYDWFVAPTDDDQAFFNSWDFVSMHTLKIELGISSEMAVHDQSFKVPACRTTALDCRRRGGGGRGEAGERLSSFREKSIGESCVVDERV